MWTGETIFSEGDLYSSWDNNGCIDSESDYADFIRNEYGDNISERLEHIHNMMTRLQEEERFILHTKNKH